LFRISFTENFITPLSFLKTFFEREASHNIVLKLVLNDAFLGWKVKTQLEASSSFNGR
jgi:hypothetical protein